jgi:hypothetical protein
MIALQRVMPDAVASVIRKAPLTPDKVAFAWRTTVGAAVERATSVELRGRTLHVRAKDATWRREIARSSGLIRTRLATLLGDDAVSEVEVSIG